MMRDGLKALCRQQQNMEVVGEADDFREVLEVIQDLHPHVVLVSITRGGFTNIEILGRFVRKWPAIKLLALSVLFNRAFVAEILRTGVHGFVVKQDAFDELLEAVRAVISGSTYLCSRVRQTIVDDYAQYGFSKENPFEVTLTSAELTVLRLLADGRTSKEIGMMLNLSSKTIDLRRRQLMRKLGVDSVAALVKCAIMMGMTTAVP
jgi:DNA-binding NarL/FixJ family response regulator